MKDEQETLRARSRQLDDLIRELEALRKGLTSGGEIDRVFESAGTWRARLPALRSTTRRR